MKCFKFYISNTNLRIIFQYFFPPLVLPTGLFTGTIMSKLKSTFFVCPFDDIFMLMMTSNSKVLRIFLMQKKFPHSMRRNRGNSQLYFTLFTFVKRKSFEPHDTKSLLLVPSFHLHALNIFILFHSLPSKKPFSFLGFFR